jgi:Putative transposase
MRGALARGCCRSGVPGAPWVTATGTRQAHLDGFDLHANAHVAADNRDGLEQLARYVLRPPIAQSG